MVQKWPHRRVGLHDCFEGDSGLADLRQVNQWLVLSQNSIQHLVIDNNMDERERK